MSKEILPKPNEKLEKYKEYMERVGKEKIPCYEPLLGKEEIDNLISVIESGWLSEGRFTRLFEDKLSTLCSRKFALSFSNATAAMIVGMKALGIGEGDEVIVPAFSHPADPNAIAQTGAKPVFSDVNEDTFCLDISNIKSLITKNTKAILYISVYGNVGNIEELCKFAKDNNLFLINDCAPALGGEYKNKSIASFGDFSVLSFFADKTITTGEGGMLLTDNSEIIEESNIYKHDGRRERGHDLIERLGYNFRVTEMQSAIGCAQLNKLDEFIKRKLEIYDRYKDNLLVNNKVKLFVFNNNGKINPHRMIIMVEDSNKLITYLSSEGIGVRTLFVPMHSQPIYAQEGYFPVSDKLYKTGVCLPSAPSLTDDKVDFICKKINEFYGFAA